MCSWLRPGSVTGSSSLQAPVADEQKARKRRRRAFCLTRIKSRNGSDRQQQQPAANNNNNNTPFLIRCQIGKEIKHICSNCRGTELRDGESSEQGLIVVGEEGGRPPYGFEWFLSSVTGRLSGFTVRFWGRSCRWPLQETLVEVEEFWVFVCLALGLLSKSSLRILYPQDFTLID